jgi:hypothetical protein
VSLTSRGAQIGRSGADPLLPRGARHVAGAQQAIRKAWRKRSADTAISFVMAPPRNSSSTVSTARYGCAGAPASSLTVSANSSTRHAATEREVVGSAIVITFAYHPPKKRGRRTVGDTSKSRNDSRRGVPPMFSSGSQPWQFLRRGRIWLPMRGASANPRFDD